MVKLNRKIEYALVALKYFSNKLSGRLTTAKEISLGTGVPFDAASRVMQLMAQKEILKAEHGVNGGYLLVKDLQRLSFLEVIEAVSGPVEVVRCISGDEECELFVNCNVISPLKNFNDKLAQFYKTLMVSELLQIREPVRNHTSQENAL